MHICMTWPGENTGLAIMQAGISVSFVIILSLYSLFSQVSLQRAHDDVEVSLASARQEIASLKTTVSQMVADASTMQCQLEAVKVF